MLGKMSLPKQLALNQLTWPWHAVLGTPFSWLRSVDASLRSLQLAVLPCCAAPHGSALCCLSAKQLPLFAILVSQISGDGGFI